MITPLPSISTLKGNPCKLYFLVTGETQNFRSLTCVQLMFIFFIMLFHDVFLLSNDTPYISNPFPTVKTESLYFLYNSANLGCSFRHGAHHEAQKSINTILPLREDNVTVSPLRLGSLISGAMVPMFRSWD